MGKGGQKGQEFWSDFASVLSSGLTAKKLSLSQIHEDDVELLQNGESEPCPWALGAQGNGARQKGGEIP